MEKVFRTISNSLLTVFLFGLMLLPIASMTFMGVKPSKSNVLSAQDERQECVCPETKAVVTETVKETTESTKSTLTDLK